MSLAALAPIEADATLVQPVQSSAMALAFARIGVCGCIWDADSQSQADALDPLLADVEALDAVESLGRFMRSQAHVEASWNDAASGSVSVHTRYHVNALSAFATYRINENLEGFQYTFIASRASRLEVTYDAYHVLQNDQYSITPSPYGAFIEVDGVGRPLIVSTLPWNHSEIFDIAAGVPHSMHIWSIQLGAEHVVGINESVSRGASVQWRIVRQVAEPHFLFLSPLFLASVRCLRQAAQGLGMPGGRDAGSKPPACSMRDCGTVQ